MFATQPVCNAARAAQALHSDQYIYNRFWENIEGENPVVTRNVNRVAVNQRITISMVGFIYRGGLLWNHLSDVQRQEMDTGKFKREVRKWVELKVSIKPG
jgi:hypothetical protein